MERLKDFATWHTYLFSALVTLLVLIFYIIAAVSAAILSSGTIGSNLIEALGRTAGAGVLAFIIIKLGWQKACGLTRFGAPTAWLLALGILGYEFITHVYPLADGTNLGSANVPGTVSVALNALATGPLEEIAFRGIILYASLRIWSGTKAGIWKSVVFSALLFGASHLIHILFGRPLPLSLIIVVNASLAGIYYAAIVLRWAALWPVIAIHSLLNASVAIVEMNTPATPDPTNSLLIAMVLQLPVVFLGLFLISRLQPTDVVLAET